jgi:transposase-like protein
MTIRSTYALDVDAVRTLEEIARRWGVSKSEALRRAIRTAGAHAEAPQRSPSEALDELQRSLGLTAAAARAWARRVRQERRAAPRERG